MNGTPTPIYARVRDVRERVGTSQQAAAEALEISQATYSRVEDGSRVLRGDELVALADLFGVRVAAITGIAEISDRARCAARTDGSPSAMSTMSHRAFAYLELDDYLAQNGISPS